MNILSRLLQKKNIKAEDLTPEEKDTIQNWKVILSKEITLDTISNFCQYQLSEIERQFKDLNNSKEKLERLVIQHSVYSSIRDLIKTPQADRESLINYLTSLI